MSEDSFIVVLAVMLLFFSPIMSAEMQFASAALLTAAFLYLAWKERKGKKK